MPRSAFPILRTSASDYSCRVCPLSAAPRAIGAAALTRRYAQCWYLRWLAKHEQEPDEAPPLGIILCTGKKREQIELLELDQTGIHVAEYLTGLPSRQLLEQKLHEAVALSKARLENRVNPAEGEAENEK